MDELVEWLRTQVEAKRADADSLHDLGCGAIRFDGTCDCGIPTETIARCEAEMAILDAHSPWHATWGCTRCAVWVGGIPEREKDPCLTVRLFASGYRNRDGYKAEWKP